MGNWREKRNKGEGLPEQDEAKTDFHFLHSLLMGLTSVFASHILRIKPKKSVFIRHNCV